MTMTSSPSSRNAANAANMPARQSRSPSTRESTFISSSCNDDFLSISCEELKSQPSQDQVSCQSMASRHHIELVSISVVLWYVNTDSLQHHPTHPSPPEPKTLEV